MKAIPLILITFAMILSSHAADPAGRDPQYDQILAGLQMQIEFVKAETIKEEVAPAIVWEESDKEWSAVMKNFRAMLTKAGLGDREDLIRSKEQVHEGWKRRCRVLMDRLSEKDSTLRRYDEGLEGSTGYVILVAGKPKYWLHRRFNRERDNYR